MPAEPSPSACLRFEALEDRLTPSLPAPPTTGTPLLYVRGTDVIFAGQDSVVGVPGSALTVDLGRAGDTSVAVSVTVDVSGAATAGARVAPGSYTVTFAPGQTIAGLFLPIITDNVAAPNERVAVTLSNPTGGAALLGGGGTLTRTVVNPNEAALVATSIQPSQYASGDTTVGVSSANPAVVLSADYRTQFAPFAGYRGAVFVARGDASGDGVADVFAGAAVSGHVKVLDGATGAELRSFLAYAGYTGAVRVAAADVNGDGFADVVTAAEVNGHVKVFDGQNGAEVASFLAAPGFAGPVDVAVTQRLGMVPAPSESYIVTAAQGRVRAFNPYTRAAQAVIGGGASEFAPYAGYTGPVYVAVADVTGDGIPDLITGASNGHLKTFDGSNGALLASFLDPRGAVVDVTAADADGATAADADGATAAGVAYDVVAGESAVFSAYSGQTGVRFPTAVGIDRLNTNSVYVG